MGLISCAEGASLTTGDKAIFEQHLLMTTSLWTGFYNNVFVCVWGLIPPTLMSEQAYLWLYTTEAIKSHEFLFIRHSQIAVEEMLKEYPVITGITTVGLTQTIRWLRWLGATFGEPNGRALPFVIRKK